MIATAVAVGAMLSARAPRVRPELIWREGGRSVWVTPCTGPGDYDDGCSQVELRSHRAARRIGFGYMGDPPTGVQVLWSHHRDVSGPVLAVLGRWGGSGGNVDLIVLERGGAFTRTKHADGDELQIVGRAGRARLALEYAIAAFPSGAHAARVRVPVPTVWNGRGFILDLLTLGSRRFDEEDLRVRRAAVETAMERALAAPPIERGDLQTAAVQALAGLMLSGRADLAHRVLVDAWPRDKTSTLNTDRLPGREAWWRALCTAVVTDGLWRDLRMAQRLPHADVIEAGVRAAAA